MIPVPRSVAVAIPVAIVLVISSAAAQSGYLLDVEDAAISDSTPGVVRVLLGNEEDLTGWSYGVCHDVDVLTILEVNAGAAIMAYPPEFHAVDVCEPCGGYTVGAVYFGAGLTFLPMGVDQELDLVLYASDVAAPATTNIEFCETLGNPPVAIVVVVYWTGEVIVPDTDPGVVTIGGLFSRGDVDGDGSLGLPDPIRALNALFVPGAEPLSCEDAADIDDDGVVNLGDPVALLGVLFLGDPPPPAPHPDCGADPTDDVLDCAVLPICP